MAVHPVHGYKIKPQEDIKTIKRNARERNRVQTVNSGFDTLKQHLPGTAHLKKVSKVTILTHAMEYISYLTRVLHDQQSQTMMFSEFSHQRAMVQQQQLVASNGGRDKFSLCQQGQHPTPTLTQMRGMPCKRLIPYNRRDQKGGKTKTTVVVILSLTLSSSGQWHL